MAIRQYAVDDRCIAVAVYLNQFHLQLVHFFLVLQDGLAGLLERVVLLAERLILEELHLLPTLAKRFAFKVLVVLNLELAHRDLQLLLEVLRRDAGSVCQVLLRSLSAPVLPNEPCHLFVLLTLAC